MGIKIREVSGVRLWQGRTLALTVSEVGSPWLLGGGGAARTVGGAEQLQEARDG